MAWDDEKREKAVELYTAAEPTPETTMDIVQEVAEAIGETVNGTRMALTKAGVYIKKATTAKASGDGKEKKKSTRVSKAEAQKNLIEVLENKEVEIDEAIIEKLTGKAAVYFTKIILELN